MANSALIQSFRSEYSENILPITALVTDDTTINSFDDGFVEVSNDYQFSDNKSIKLEMTLSPTQPRSNIFNLGSDLTTTVKYDGRYIFSFRFLDNSSGTTFPQVSMGFNVFINSVLTHTFENFYDLSENQDLKFYTLAQTFDLNANDVVDFSFFCSIGSIAPPPTLILYFSGFKLELDDRFLGIPSIYSKPINVIENEITTLTGWARYLDSTYTESSPLSISNGVRSTLTNNALNKLETQLPSDATTFFNETTQKIIATNDGDAYSLSIRFKAKMNVLQGYFDIDLDIGGTQGIISQESILFTRGANTEQRFDIDLVVFSGSTFVTNGGTLSVTPQNGNIEIYDISFVIVRTHKAR
jgi:hypothetical protein